MIRSVGIDLSRTGSHQVRCLDEQAKPCDSFSFDSTLEGLENFEKRVFSNGDTPTIIFGPTGLAWIPMAIYLRARHPECQMVKARLQKVAALRRYLRSYTKSDRVDGVTLAKMPQDYTVEEWDYIMNVNLRGAFLCAKAVYPSMKANGGGKIINIGSMTSLYGLGRTLVYGCTKMGVLSMTYSLALA